MDPKIHRPRDFTLREAYGNMQLTWMMLPLQSVLAAVSPLPQICVPTQPQVARLPHAEGNGAHTGAMLAPP